MTFFELIADNLDCISEPLRSSIVDWVDSGDKGWVSWAAISPEFINSDSCIVMMNGVEQNYVTGYNRILKKIKLIQKV